MARLLTRGEIKAATTLGAEAASHAEMRDPWGWADLTGHADATFSVVKRRIEVGRTPARAHVFRWPKEKSEYRPMAYLDPYDQIIYRAVAGRLVEPIYATLDDQAVSSPRLVQRPPRWRLEHWGKANARRRDVARALLGRHSYMGGYDVRNFFPTVRCAGLEQAYGHLPLHAPSFEFLLGWLGELDETYGVQGLPIGHEGSHVLGNGLLGSCDTVLAKAGVPFVRYVDDTWLFLHDYADFDGITGLYRDGLGDLGLALNDDKTFCFDDWMASELIDSSAINYLSENLEAQGEIGRAAGIELFEYAMEDPLVFRTELRRALRALTEARDPFALTALRADSGLLRIAPGYWSKYIRSLLHAKPTRRMVGDDWLVEQICAELTKSDAYMNLLYLQAADGIGLSKAHGERLFDIAAAPDDWASPVRVWAARVWSHSSDYNPNKAVEQVEAKGELSTRRAFALTLAERRDDTKFPRWVKRVRAAHEELEPTAAWLEAA